MKLATFLTIAFCWGTCLHAQVPELTLLMPDGKELFQGGRRVPIIWSGLPAGGIATIEYSTDHGATWQVITDDAAGSSYQWDVPSIASAGCLMRIRAAVPAGGYRGGEDWVVSGGFWEIEEPQAPAGADGGGGMTGPARGRMDLR